MPKKPQTPPALSPFGLRLEAARKHAKLTQGKLAEKVGIGQPTISEAKFAVGSKHTPALAVVLDVDPVWLSTGDPEVAPDWFDKRQGLGELPLKVVSQHDREKPTASILRPAVMLPLISGGTMTMMEVKNDDPALAAAERIEAVHPSLSDYAKAYRMPDDSLGPRPAKGDILEFDVEFDHAKLTGDSIVMVKRGDAMFVRRYDPIEIASNSLVVVAKMKLFYYLAED